mmetsp:Transcript_11352/g.25232  ORF Transcript_11352/g.25232 Transcript_11352/m.25232 type:complete len:172 (-) Transcript_11352:45-560(-)
MSDGDAQDPRGRLEAQLRERIAELEERLERQRPQALNDFSFVDDDGKCKIYVELGSELLGRSTASGAAAPAEGGGAVGGGGISHAEAAVSVTFFEKGCAVSVMAPELDGTVAERRSVTFICEEIVPGKCVYKVDRTKGRLVLLLKKLDEAKAWDAVMTAEGVRVGRVTEGA